MVVAKLVKGYFSPKNSFTRAVSRPGKKNDIAPGLIPTKIFGLNLDGGLYVTPDTPADPQDCTRYPDSPFCGGNPIRPFFATVIPDVIYTDCDIGIRLNPILGFIALPPVAIVYRKRECRKSKKAVIPPNSAYNILTPFPELRQGNPYCFTVLFNTYNYRKYAGYLVLHPVEVQYERTETRRLIDFGSIRIGDVEPPLRRLQYLLQYQNPDFLLFKLAFEYTYTETYNQAFLDFNVRPRVVNPEQQYINTETVIHDAYYEPIPGVNFIESEFHNAATLFNNGSMDANGDLHDVSVAYVIWINADADAANTVIHFNNFRYAAPYDEIYQTRFNILESRYEVLSTCVIEPPPPPSDLCLMTPCCPCDDTLLKLLLKKVNKLSEIVGIDDYPANLPDSLISKDEGFFGNSIPNPSVDIPSLTRLFGWFIERFDEIMGQFEIAIEVKDSDATIPGDQPVGLKLPNVAESIGEMIGLLLQSASNSEALINICTRAMIEGGQDKQQNFKTYMLVQAIADYVGFNQQEIKAKLPMLFTPGEESLDKLLQETDIDVVVTDFNEKFDFQTDLIKFRKMASIIDALHYQKVNPNIDIKKQIMDKLKEARDLAKTINKTDETDWDRFVEDAETGFINTPGVLETKKPYGRKYSERPKIKDLSKSSDEPAP